jgi:uncharacterized SAM-binding protein YcdF (DUF218 family)
MFFALSKIVWFVLQPSGVLLLLLLGAVGLNWAGRLVAARRCVVAAATLLVLSLTPLANVLSLPLEQRFARADLAGAPVTGIIILGGSEDARVGRARHAHALNEAAERFTEAVALARRLPQARIVFTGGTGTLLGGFDTEAAIASVMLTDMGVGEDRIVLESQSRNTWENAVFTRDLVQPQPGERWLVITSAWHMPRTMGVFAKARFPVEPWPVDFRTQGWADGLSFFDSPVEGLKRLDYISKEYVGLLAYWLTGRSSSLFPGPTSG